MHGLLIQTLLDTIWEVLLLGPVRCSQVICLRLRVYILIFFPIHLTDHDKTIAKNWSFTHARSLSGMAGMLSCLAPALVGAVERSERRWVENGTTGKYFSRHLRTLSAPPAECEEAFSQILCHAEKGGGKLAEDSRRKFRPLSRNLGPK